MRKQVNMGTYMKVKDYFKEYPDKEFTATALRDDLNIDYLSVKLVLDTLMTEKFIKVENNKYKLGE